MRCSFDIHYIGGEAYLRLADFEGNNNLGFRKNARLFVMELEECPDQREERECSVCKGKGVLNEAFPNEHCDNCDGTGKVKL